jgi:hypothetical protein
MPSHRELALNQDPRHEEPRCHPFWRINSTHPQKGESCNCLDAMHPVGQGRRFSASRSVTAQKAACYCIGNSLFFPANPLSRRSRPLKLDATRLTQVQKWQPKLYRRFSRWNVRQLVPSSTRPRPCRSSAGRVPHPGGHFANPKAQKDISSQSPVVNVLTALNDPVSLGTSSSPFDAF